MFAVTGIDAPWETGKSHIDGGLKLIHCLHFANIQYTFEACIRYIDYSCQSCFNQTG